MIALVHNADRAFQAHMVESAHERGRPDIKPSHNAVFAHLGDDAATRRRPGGGRRDDPAVDGRAGPRARRPRDPRDGAGPERRAGQAGHLHDRRARGSRAPASGTSGPRGPARSRVRRRLRGVAGGSWSASPSVLAEHAPDAGSGVADAGRPLAELPEPALRVPVVARAGVDVTTWGAPPSSPRPPGPTYVAPGRSAVAAISVGQAPGGGGLRDRLDGGVEDRGDAAGGAAVLAVGGEVGAGEAGVRGQRPAPAAPAARARRSSS